jgi:hypothetical protein
LKSENDFSLADAAAARYDTVIHPGIIILRCFGIVSDDPDKTRLIGCCQPGGLYFLFTAFRLYAFSSLVKKARKSFRQTA